MKSFLPTKPNKGKRNLFKSLAQKALGIFFIPILFIYNSYANTTDSEDKVLQDLEKILTKIAQNASDGKPDSTYFYEGFQPNKSKRENIIFASSDIDSINTHLQKLDQKGRKTIIYMGYLWREYKGKDPNAKPSKAEMQQFADAQQRKINDIYKRLEEKFYLQTSNLSLHIVLRVSVKVHSKNSGKSPQASTNLWDWDIFFDSFYPRADLSNTCRNSMMQTMREAIKVKQESSLSKAPQKAMIWRASLLEQTISTCPTEPMLTGEQSKDLIALLNYIKSKTANKQQVLLHPAPETPAELMAENVKLGNTTYKKLQFHNYTKANPSFSKPEDYQLIQNKDDKTKATFQFSNKDSTDKVLFTLTLSDKDAEGKKDSLEKWLMGRKKSNFLKYQTKIFDHEGQFVDDPVDKGGATNKGITFSTFELYAKSDLGIEPTLDNLKNLTNEQASIIYKKRFWDKVNADQINNGSIAYMLYDFTVNAGNNAAKQLQKTLIDLGHKVDINGIISSQNIQLINSLNAKVVFNKFKERRLEYYQSIVNNSISDYLNSHPQASEEELLKNTQKRFEKGWKNRTNEISFEN